MPKSPQPETTSQPSSQEGPDGPSLLVTSPPRFLPPTQPETTPETSSPSGRSADPSPEPDPAASALGWSDQPRDDEPLEEPRRRPRTGASQASSLASRQSLEDAASKVVLTATTILHQQAAGGDPLAEELGVWLADDQDVEGIAKPAAGILSRRSSDLGGGNPDLADGIALAIAVAGYVVKQFAKLRALRMARRAGLDSQLDDEARP